jgi:hypothetical protein
LSDRPANTRRERAVGVRGDERLAERTGIGRASREHERFDAEDESFCTEASARKRALERVESAQRACTVARGERPTSAIERRDLVGERGRRDDSGRRGG